MASDPAVAVEQQPTAAQVLEDKYPDRRDNLSASRRSMDVRVGPFDAEQPQQPEQPDEIQVAGGRLGPGLGPAVRSFLNMLGAGKRVPEPGAPALNMPPTAIEEQLPSPKTPEGKPLTYNQQRNQAAKQLLSAEGHARWSSEREAKRQLVEEKISDPEGLMATARQAQSYEQGALGGNVAPRASTEESAEELIEQLATPRERAVHLLEQEDFNLDLMTSGDDVKAVIAVMGERLKDPVEQAKRGVQKHEVTQELARELLADEAGFTKRVLKRRGSGFAGRHDSLPPQDGDHSWHLPGSEGFADRDRARHECVQYSRGYGPRRSARRADHGHAAAVRWSGPYGQAREGLSGCCREGRRSQGFGVCQPWVGLKNQGYRPPGSHQRPVVLAEVRHEKHSGQLQLLNLADA